MYHNVELIEQYVKDNYNLDDKLIKIKLLHTVRVYELMIKLVEMLNLKEHDKVLALYIALFHDIGRFYEAKHNKKFNNKYDHANDSVTILFEDGLIKEFDIKEEDYELIKKAIYYHNKLDVPEELTDREKYFCHMIRDVDKIDIYHVLANEYQKEFNYMPTNEVLNGFYDKELINVNDIKNPSDSIVLYLSFQDQLYFRESLALLNSKGYLEEFINSIKVSDNNLVKDTFSHLKEETYDHRDNNMYKRRVLKKEVNYGRIR